MRIITTWMYFDPSQVETNGRRWRGRPRSEDAEPGIGIAWCAGDTAGMMSISNLKAFQELPGTHSSEFTEEALRRYVDGFLADDDDYQFTRKDRPFRNSAVVDYVLQEPFVIERSPPVHLNLKGVLTHTNLPIWIGTYIGWSVAPEHSVLLFITVPGGIIVVSSAVGLASALASGLGTSIKRLFRHK